MQNKRKDIQKNSIKRDICSYIHSREHLHMLTHACALTFSPYVLVWLYLAQTHAVTGEAVAHDCAADEVAQV